MEVTNAQIEAGQAVYTRRTLRVYDIVVHGISNRYIWKCPTSLLTDQYNAQVSGNHLDVGVGTGYFLDRCKFPIENPRVALMDLNASTLAFASQRVARHSPATFQRNVLEPIAFDAKGFDSIGINYLLHCLPGSIDNKAIVFDHLKALANPGAVIFGSTLLHGGVTRNWMAQRLMAVYNRKGIFCNTEDDLAGLEHALASRFSEYSLEVHGCAALFSGRV